MQHDNDNNQRPAEFDKRVEGYALALKRYAFRLGWRDYDAEDMAQEAIATALQRWRGFKPAEGRDDNLFGWLCFILRERSFAVRYKRQTQNLAEAGFDTLSVLEPNQEHATDITTALDAMSAIKPEHAELLMRTGRGDSQTEIAADEGVSHQAIHLRIKAARKSLSKVLARNRVIKSTKHYEAA